MASSTFHGDMSLKNEDVTECDDQIQNIKYSSPPVAKVSVEERFETQEIFKRPLCLVSTDDKMNLQINEEVLLQIKRIDVPISVVGVCGAYRTGKSYLMNILAQEKTGFALGSTVRSKTKGIWAWCKPHPTVSDQVLVLLDTEGLADAAKGDEEHDLKLFCLTMLMSSTLIYNMKGVIDQEALKTLSFVSDVTKQVSVAGVKYSNEEDDKSTLQIISPQFVLCLRDFYYDLIDEGEITADEYMESCLLDSPDKRTEEFNNIRRSIRNFFPNRTCFVLAMPAINKQLKCLETLDDESIDPSFRKDVKELQTFVYNSDPKYLNRITKHPWDGNTFDDFLRAYTQDLSSGRKLEYGSAMEGAGRNHNEKLVDTVCCKYAEQLDTLKLPQQSKFQLMNRAINSMHELLEEYRQDAYPYEKAHYEQKAMEKMERMRNDLVKENNCEVIKLCLGYLQRKHKEMIENSKRKYHVEGGICAYQQDFDTLLQGYELEFDEYDRDERCEALKKLNDSIKLEVAEMKYDVKMQEEKNKYEELRKDEDAKMEAYKKEQEQKLEDIQKKEREETKRMYEERMKKIMDEKKELKESFAGFGGFLNRLMFLITGSMD